MTAYKLTKYSGAHEEMGATTARDEEMGRKALDMIAPMLVNGEYVELTLEPYGTIIAATS